jgi:ribonuclease HII
MPRRTADPPSLFAAPESPDRAPRVPDWLRERQAWEAGWARVAGVDEAGRGPLAGPVVAAAVILPRELEVEGLRDSKILDAEARERLYVAITGAAVGWAVGEAGVEEIDRLNILRATHLAMHRALAGLTPPPDGALVDGLPVQGIPCPHVAVVKGDALCVSIAAAAIVAKVTRDRRMRELDACHPGYGLARHKGYATAEHLRALRERGPAPCHRRSFRPVAELYEAPSSALPGLGDGEGS